MNQTRLLNYDHSSIPLCFKALTEAEVKAWNALPLIEKLAKLRAAAGKAMQGTGHPIAG